MKAEYLKYSWFDPQTNKHGEDIFRHCGAYYTFAGGFLFVNTESNVVTVISAKAGITGVLKSGIVRDELSGHTTIADFSNGNKVRIERENGMIYTLERSNSRMTDLQFCRQQFSRRP